MLQGFTHTKITKNHLTFSSKHLEHSQRLSLVHEQSWSTGLHHDGFQQCFTNGLPSSDNTASWAEIDTQYGRHLSLFALTQIYRQGYILFTLCLSVYLSVLEIQSNCGVYIGNGPNKYKRNNTFVKVSYKSTYNIQRFASLLLRGEESRVSVIGSHFSQRQKNGRKSQHLYIYVTRARRKILLRLLWSNYQTAALLLSTFL